jgi:hypothetical protein
MTVKKTLLLTILVVLISLLFLPISSTPKIIHLLGSKGFDKIGHATLFFTLFVITNNLKSNKLFLYLSVVLLAFGTEYLQSFFGRTCDIYDSFADLYGYFSAMFFYSYKQK